MIPEEILGQKHVRDVYRNVVAEPSLIHPDADILTLLQTTIEDSRTRHVYVVDDDNRLIGSARMLAIVEYLFPLATALDSGAGLLAPTIDLDAQTVRDIMNEQPVAVTLDDALDEAAVLMMREGITELPVIDEERHIVGQINMYEIIRAFLDEQANR